MTHAVEVIGVIQKPKLIKEKTILARDVALFPFRVLMHLTFPRLMGAMRRQSPSFRSKWNFVLEMTDGKGKRFVTVEVDDKRMSGVLREGDSVLVEGSFQRKNKTVRAEKITSQKTGEIISKPGIF